MKYSFADKYIVRQRSYGDVQGTIQALSKACRPDAQITCFLHCMQKKSSGFYLELIRQYGVEVIYLDYVDSVFPKVFEALFGRAALIKVSTERQILDLFPQVVEQGLGGIYFFESKNSQAIIKGASAKGFDFAERIRLDESHLIYMIDEDAASGPEFEIEIISIGAKCDPGLKSAVLL